MTPWELEDLAGTEVFARLTQRGMESELAARLVYLRDRGDEQAIQEIVKVLTGRAVMAVVTWSTRRFEIHPGGEVKMIQTALRTPEKGWPVWAWRCRRRRHWSSHFFESTIASVSAARAEFEALDG